MFPIEWLLIIILLLLALGFHIATRWKIRLARIILTLPVVFFIVFGVILLIKQGNDTWVETWITVEAYQREQAELAKLATQQPTSTGTPTSVPTLTPTPTSTMTMIPECFFTNDTGDNSIVKIFPEHSLSVPADQRLPSDQIKTNDVYTFHEVYADPNGFVWIKATLKSRSYGVITGWIFNPGVTDSIIDEHNDELVLYGSCVMTDSNKLPEDFIKGNS